MRAILTAGPCSGKSISVAAICENGGVESGPVPVVGIDFGTTNSSVGLSRQGTVQMVSFAHGAAQSPSSRSLLYLERQRQPAGRPIAAWSGAEGVAHYVAADPFDDAVQGRLLQSLKSYLSARDLQGTEIFGRPYGFVELLARMLRDLRRWASEYFGFEVTRALSGRPVMFVGAATEDDNAFAEERLREAYLQAGFTEVHFAMEPVAAAFAYQASVRQQELVLIGDFGGGTTDFSLLRVAPGTLLRRSAAQGSAADAGTTADPCVVLGTAGVGLAGDAFDARLVRKLISPALGSESEARSLGKRLPALPAWVFANLERWHTLSFLRTREVQGMLQTAERNALEPAKIAALRAVVEHDLGYRLHEAVQRVKVALSTRQEADFLLQTEALTLRIPVERQQFEGWIAPELERMRASLDGLLRSTGTDPGQVHRVFLTGGTSLVPAVRRVFTDTFGEGRVQGGEAFTSVAYGLARMADGMIPGP